MNKVFIIVGILCAGVGVALWATAPEKKVVVADYQETLVSSGVPAEYALRTPGRPSSAECGHGHQGAHACDQAKDAASSEPIDLLSDSFPVQDRPDYTAVCGDMPALIKQIRVTTGVSEVVLPAFPARGRAEVMIRSTLGGIDRGAQVSTVWSRSDEGVITFKGPEGEAVACLQTGCWTLKPNTTSPVFLEIARLVTALSSTFAEAQKVRADSGLLLFGQSWSVTGLANDVALCESNDRLDVDGPRDALIFALAEGGTIAGIERYQADPSTVSEPGFMVRRVRISGLDGAQSKHDH